MVRRAAVFLLGAFIGLAGCGEMRRAQRLHFPDRSLATVERVAAEIDARLNGFERRTGKLTSGDVTSVYTAWFDAGELRKIEERLSLGEYGSSTILYYFNNRTLFFYHELARRSGMGTVGTGAGERIERAFAYDSIGQIMESRKLVDGRPAALEDYEVMAVRNHAAELKRELAR